MHLPPQRRTGAPVPSPDVPPHPAVEAPSHVVRLPHRLDEQSRAKAVVEQNVVGERNDREHSAQFTRGLFPAAPQRRGVEGVFCGPDHVGTDAGDHSGIHLGHGPGTGFSTDRPEGNALHRRRFRCGTRTGAR